MTFELSRGDRNVLLVANLKDKDGTATTFSATDVLRWTGRYTYSSDVALFVKTSNDDIAIDVGDDDATVTILPEDWGDIVAPVDLPFVWDLEIDIDGDPEDRYTLLRGTGTILADVTHEPESS